MNLNEITTKIESIGRHLESKYHNKPLSVTDKESVLENYGVPEKAFDKVFLHFCNPNRGTKFEKRREKR